MNTKLLQGVVTLFAELTPSLSTTERMDLFKSMLPKETAPIASVAPVQVNPPAAQWPSTLATPKINMAQALGLAPRPTASEMAQKIVASQQTQQTKSVPQDPIDNRVIAVVAEQFGVDVSQVKLANHVIADLGGDDLDVVELIMGLEDEFGIELDDDQWERVGTVAKLVTLVKNALNKTSAQAVAHRVYPENGRLYVNIRKHPAGFKQPTGKRKVTRLNVVGDFVEVGIGNGLQGWKINTKQQAPSYLDFIVNGEKGQKVSLPEAIAYWKRHNP